MFSGEYTTSDVKYTTLLKSFLQHYFTTSQHKTDFPQQVDAISIIGGVFFRVKTSSIENY